MWIIARCTVASSAIFELTISTCMGSRPFKPNGSADEVWEQMNPKGKCSYRKSLPTMKTPMRNLQAMRLERMLKIEVGATN